MGAVFAIGLMSENPKVHAAITVIYAALLVGVTVVFARPASFGVAQ